MPNGSFENYSTCPNGTGQADYATSWMILSQTPDYFNSCSTTTCNCAVPGQLCASVPLNCAGYQNAASGNGCTGFYTYLSSSNNYREIINSQLTLTLNIGQKYFIKFKIAFTWGGNSNTATDKIGVRFTTIQHNSVTALPPINNFSHVYSSVPVTDTINWTTIFKSFVADSNYKYIEVGNFFDDANTVKSIEWPSGSNWSYYYLDDLCVSTDSLYTLNFSTNLFEEKTLHSSTKFFPNPCYENFIHFNKMIQKTTISLVNIFGQEVKSIFIEHSNYLEINVPDGIYFIKIREGDVLTNEKLIIKNR